MARNRIGRGSVDYQRGKPLRLAVILTKRRLRVSIIGHGLHAELVLLRELIRIGLKHGLGHLGMLLLVLAFSIHSHLVLDIHLLLDEILLLHELLFERV